jgi:ribonuclease R
MLDDLAEEGALVPAGGQRYRARAAAIERRGAEIVGPLHVNARGFGFVSAAGLPSDVFIPAEAMRGALHGDTVAARVVLRSKRGLEGEVTRVMERRNPRVGGVLRRRGCSTWLEPDDTRLRGPIVLAMPEGLEGKDGDACVATITRFPELYDENPEGVVEAVLGPAGEPNAEVAKILAREGIEENHPPEAVAEAEAFGEEVPPEALVGRVDLRHVPLPTIDPEDARDHDDAVWVTRADDGSYTAWIAIADVSSYVTPGTALDAAALARGNSLYFPDRAIPMLPRALSSELCSLLPNVTRLCLCVEVDLDPAGVVRGARIVEGFMRSAAKLTYGGVAWDLSRLLRARRMRRGALDFDLPEAKVLLHEVTGAPIGVERRTRDPGVSKAYQLIEELMLLANECVARFLVERDVPAIFRDHGKPDEAKLGRFAALCEELGVPFEVEDAEDPKKLSTFLKKVANHPQRQVLHMLLLRAMKQAYYDVANIGHFGLASDAYLHFTSPIRRYADLRVHRAVRAVLRGEPIDRRPEGVEALRVAAAAASARERSGMEIEREVVDLYRALFMRSKIGSIVEGTVSGLVGTGVFVTADEPFVDVLVRLESLGPDDYQLDDDGLRVVGARSGDRVALGDRMPVSIEDVSIVRRTVYGRRLAPREDDTGRKKRRGDKEGKDKKTKRGAREAPARGKGGRAKRR